MNQKSLEIFIQITKLARLIEQEALSARNMVWVKDRDAAMNKIIDYTEAIKYADTLTETR